MSSYRWLGAAATLAGKQVSPVALGLRQALSQGGVAQLGERLLCKQEVIGSIPFTSTSYLEERCGMPVILTISGR